MCDWLVESEVQIREAPSEGPPAFKRELVGEKLRAQERAVPHGDSHVGLLGGAMRILAAFIALDHYGVNPTCCQPEPDKT